MRQVNCTRCGKVFSTIGSMECPECREEMDVYLRQAKECLYRNPNISLAELSEKSEVPLEQLEYFLRKGRLAFRSAVGPELTCEMCNKPISGGARCAVCQEKLTKLVRESAAEKRRMGPSMHSLDMVKARREQGGRREASR